MKKNKKAITLIELMVVISIITILGIGATRINFTRLNDRQKIDIYTNKIINMYEKVRNNALLGKGIGTSFYVPEKWKIDFSNSGSGQIISSYYTGGVPPRVEYEKLIFSDLYEISNLRCINLSDDNEDLIIPTTITIPGTIEINGNNLTATGRCDDTAGNGADYYKKIELTIKYKKNFEKKLEINTVNGLIQKK